MFDIDPTTRIYQTAPPHRREDDDDYAQGSPSENDMNSNSHVNEEDNDGGTAQAPPREPAIHTYTTSFVTTPDTPRDWERLEDSSGSDENGNSEDDSIYDGSDRPTPATTPENYEQSSPGRQTIPTQPRQPNPVRRRPRLIFDKTPPALVGYKKLTRKAKTTNNGANNARTTKTPLTWKYYLGDGFSDNEAKPDYLNQLSRKRKLHAAAAPVVGGVLDLTQSTPPPMKKQRNDAMASIRRRKRVMVVDNAFVSSPTKTSDRRRLHRRRGKQNRQERDDHNPNPTADSPPKLSPIPQDDVAASNRIELGEPASEEENKMMDELPQDMEGGFIREKDISVIAADGSRESLPVHTPPHDKQNNAEQVELENHTPPPSQRNDQILEEEESSGYETHISFRQQGVFF
ncbi:hypothetical protein B0T17DRAFT_653262 [Bombardia bombarda]|uniref:Uncharacterized protein n=1 Tax=Bombardia bombarda TaxID=252184 RepID=A0AA39X9B1_9PEZI|nr:hypothetical protein B0T17DRAFT_653262 [Bombardia bombarda]